MKRMQLSIRWLKIAAILIATFVGFGISTIAEFPLDPWGSSTPPGCPEGTVVIKDTFVDISGPEKRQTGINRDITLFGTAEEVTNTTFICSGNTEQTTRALLFSWSITPSTTSASLNPPVGSLTPAFKATAEGIYTVTLKEPEGGKSDKIEIEVLSKPNIEAIGLEVTQGIQNFANDIPLIAEKRTFARFHVRTDLEGVNVNNVTARLKLTRGSDSLELTPANPGGVITVRSNGGNRANLNDSFLFEIPPEWRSAGTVTFEAEVLPPPGADREPGDNAFPLTLTFNVGPQLCVDFVRLHLHPLTYSMDDPTFGPILRRMEKIYPVSDIDGIRIIRGGSVAPFWHWAGEDWHLPDDGGIAVLSRLWWYNAWTNDPSDCPFGEAVYYGMAHGAPSSREPSGRGNLAGDESWGTMTSFAAHPRFGNTRYFGPMGGMIMGHEIGHNYDRYHVNCPPGVPEDLDGGYPFPSCQIASTDATGFWGFDVDFAVTSTTGPIAPWAAGDLMSYSHLHSLNIPQWISSYTYCALLRQLQQGVPGMGGRTPLDPTVVCKPSTAEMAYDSAQGAPASAMDLAQAREFLATSGAINTKDNTVVLETFYRLARPKARLLARSGQLRSHDIYRLELRDETGQTLYVHTFAPAPVADRMGSPLLPFTEILPYDPRTVEIVLKRGDTELASRLVTKNSPEVKLLSPNGGEVWGDKAMIVWDGTDADGNEEELRYTVQYSADGGQNWRPIVIDFVGESFEVDTNEVPGSNQARIRVIVSDGVNTGMDQSDGVFTVLPKAPTASIASPVDGATFTPGASVLLLGYGFDLEEGRLREGTLLWSSDKEGSLGTGHEISTQKLSPGTHRITLMVRDRDGKIGTSTVAITIAPRTKLHLELTSVTASPACGQNVSHEIEVSWEASGGQRPITVGPLSVTDPTGKTQSLPGPFAPQGSIKFQVNLPSGGQVAVKAEARDATSSRTATEQVVLLTPCVPPVTLVVIAMAEGPTTKPAAIKVPVKITTPAETISRDTAFSLTRKPGIRFILEVPKEIPSGDHILVFMWWDLVKSRSEQSVLPLVLNSDIAIRARYRIEERKPTPGPLIVSVTATARQVCNPQFSHELTVKWKVTGGRPPILVTIEITGPDGKTETIKDLSLEGERKFQLNYPGGGSAKIKVTAKDASNSSSSAQSSVQLGACQ